MKIQFVSLISRENQPLYTQQFPSSTDDQFNEILKYNFLSHMALDVFESPFGPNTSAKSTLLFVHDGIHVFGTEMLTGLKVVIGCSKGEQEESDGKSLDLTEVMNDIKKEYVKYASNPFFKSDSTEVKSERFDSKIKLIVDTYNNKCGI